MARPTKQFLADLDRYSKMSDAELGVLATSEILSFLALASLLDPENNDEGTITLADAAHANLSKEIDRRILQRL